MLFLLFQLGHDRYALDTSRIVEVVPLVPLKALPQAPRGVAGLFNYHGRPVPVVDLCELTAGRPSRECLSTRIIVLESRGSGGDARGSDAPQHASGDGLGHRQSLPNTRHASRGTGRLLGLIAENATEMMRRDVEDFVFSGVHTDLAPYLGPVAPDGAGWVQWVQEDRLLNDGVREALFNQLPEETHDTG